MIEWRSIDKAMARMREGLVHKGSVSRLSFSLRLFIALNISTVTKMDNDMVVAFLAM